MVKNITQLESIKAHESTVMKISIYLDIERTKTKVT